MLIRKIMVLTIITLITLIILKGNVNLKSEFYKYVYKDNIKFATINKWYTSKFGSPLPFSNILSSHETIPVFDEKLSYSEASKYRDGVSLSVDYQYLIPSLDNGIVIFVGNKDGYGKTVIVQQENGVDVWYSNLEEINVKLYDYIKKGNLIEMADQKLYLVFIKNGEVMDYKKYI